MPQLDTQTYAIYNGEHAVGVCSSKVPANQLVVLDADIKEVIHLLSPTTHARLIPLLVAPIRRHSTWCCQGDGYRALPVHYYSV